jgi:hypothetical protein
MLKHDGNDKRLYEYIYIYIYILYVDLVKQYIRLEFFKNINEVFENVRVGCCNTLRDREYIFFYLMKSKFSYKFRFRIVINLRYSYQVARFLTGRLAFEGCAKLQIRIYLFKCASTHRYTEVVRSYAKFDVTFIQCVELRSTAWSIKAFIRCSTSSYLSSGHRRLLSW